MIINLNEMDLIKAIPWREHLHPRGKGGKFSSIRSGSSVVAKNGVEGKVTGMTDTHYHIEKEDGKTSKVARDNVIHAKDHKELTKPTKKTTTKAKPKTPPTKAQAGVKGDSASATKKPTSKAVQPKGKGAGASAKSKTKPTGDGKPVPTATKKATTKGGAKGKTAKKPAGVKDIRTDLQKNRTLAYDVGDKVGGARKDDFEKMFKEKPTMVNLGNMEKDNGAVAEKMVTKKNLVKPLDFEQEHKNGVELPVALLKKALYDRIAQKPRANTPEDRKAYMASIQKLDRHISGVKTWDNMKNAIRELSDYANKGKDGRSAEHSIANQRSFSYVNMDYYQPRVDKGIEARKNLDFEPLGEKLENFFTDWKSRESSLKTMNKNAQGGWEKYLNPEAKAKSGGAPKEGANKKWERKAEAEHLRTGGRVTKVAKPEDFVKNFGVRGVEFGNWVNDSSGKYHLQRCAEAFSDLSDTIGIDDKDISLNGRLAIAFGARGKGGAVAHYEPDRKVINMTKHGGAGSLAHEWGHAMDNILYQYSHGGTESMGLASESPMGDNDPKLKALYANLMESIKKPVPGGAGAVKKIAVNTEETRFGSYDPRRRQMVREHGVEHAMKHYEAEIHSTYNRVIDNVNANVYYKTSEERAKRVKKYERERKRALDQLPHQVAFDQYRNTGEHVKGNLEIATGTSNYVQHMKEIDGTGKDYFSTDAEMFARVFESFVQHKLDTKKQYNNYLVHGTREANVKALGAPFPVGKERAHMFKAMENLMTHVTKGKTLTKALILEVLASGRGDMTEELQKSIGYTKRSAFNVANPSEVIYIPVNRLRVMYQTDQATNWDKVNEIVERMKAGENLDPVTIGLDYDIHDGHHRYEASKLAEYEHIPCIVKGGNELEQQQAIEAYREVWKSLITDPVAPDAFAGHDRFMYRGIGHKEFLAIADRGYIQSKGKGNDADKAKGTCFSNLYSHAEGFAKTNYDLYNESKAYVIAVPKPDWIEEDEHGELVADRPVPIENMEITPIPQESL